MHALKILALALFLIYAISVVICLIVLNTGGRECSFKEALFMPFFFIIASLGWFHVV